MNDKLKMLKYSMQYGELWGSSLEYPVIKTVDGKVIGMCLEKDSPYLQAFLAAPEMLEALKRMIRHAVYNPAHNNWEIEISDSFLEHNKQLVAKAEGRQE